MFVVLLLLMVFVGFFPLFCLYFRGFFSFQKLEFGIVNKFYIPPPPHFPSGKRGVTSVCLLFLRVGVQSACDLKEGSIDSKTVNKLNNNVIENRVYQA